MKMICKPYEWGCGAEVFMINDIDADTDDFGEMVDSDAENAPEYGCGNRKFVAKYKPTEDILTKYHITSNEYFDICEKLESILYVGKCSLCD